MASKGTRYFTRNRQNADEEPPASPVRSPEGPNEAFGSSDSPENRFLRQIYQEIHDASVLGVDDMKRTRIQDTLRRTRSQRFWASVSDAHKAIYQINTEVGDNETNDSAPVDFSKREAVELTGQKTLTDAIATFLRDVRKSTTINEDILSALVESCGYPLLSICLHSEVFLQYIETSQDDYQTSTENRRSTRPLSIEDRVRALQSHQASLELFAKVRRLDFLSPIRAHEEGLQLLLSNIFKPYNMSSTRTDFGIGDTDMREIHKIDPWRVSSKHWTLPLDPNAPAEPCRLTYTVTKDVKRDYPELSLDEELTEPQELVCDSVVLKGYEWPKINNLPTDDPREDGYSLPCACCSYVRGPVPKPRTAGTHPKTCSCTLQNLHRINGMPRDERGVPRDILLEIAAGELGNGVRALQNIHEGDYLGVYVGEIYPRSKATEKQAKAGDLRDWVDSRYGGVSGEAYIMDQHMTTQRHQKPGKPARKTAKVPKKKQKRGVGDNDDDDDPVNNGAWLPPDPEEYRHFAIDSALRGNWTRYVNHSCDPNVVFAIVVLGCKALVVLQATRDITFGEWLTVDYGQEYFNKMSFACRCGMSNCLYWNMKDKAFETRTLAEAMKEKRGPTWTRGVEGLPYRASKAGQLQARNIKRQRQRAKQTQSKGDLNQSSSGGKGGEAGSTKTPGKTSRSTKTSKAAAQDAREDADDATEDSAVLTRRSGRERMAPRWLRAEINSAPAAKQPGKRAATEGAGGLRKRQRKR